MDGQSSSQDGIRNPVALPELLERSHFPPHILSSCILTPTKELGALPCWTCPSFQGTVFIPTPHVTFKLINLWIYQANTSISSTPVVFSLPDVPPTCLLHSSFAARAASSLSHGIMFYWEKYHLRNALEVPELAVSPQILSFLSSGWFC